MLIRNSFRRIRFLAIAMVSASLACASAAVPCSAQQESGASRDETQQSESQQEQVRSEQANDNRNSTNATNAESQLRQEQQAQGQANRSQTSSGQASQVQSNTYQAGTSQDNRTQFNSQVQQNQDQSLGTASNLQPLPNESPALGVLVGECPGAGVCVKDTIINGPADNAGISPGDYILGVAGRQVNSVPELQDALKSIDVSAEIPLRVWREGHEYDISVSLAAEARELPPHFKAWLGVRLSANRGNGVEIDQVVANSPAAAAGLRQGDFILRLNGEPVSTVEQLIERVGDQGPGSMLHILLRRDGQEREVDVQLGRVEEAPMAYLRQAFQSPMLQGQGGMQGGLQSGRMTSLEMIDETLDEMRGRIRALEQQIQVLQTESGQSSGSRNPAPLRANPLDPNSPNVGERTNSPSTTESNSNRNGTTDGPRSESDQSNGNQSPSSERIDDSSSNDANSKSLIGEGKVHYVMQVGALARPEWSRNRSRAWTQGNWYTYNGYPGYSYPYPYYSNYSSYNGFNYGGYPFYRSPVYGNYYYQYGGRPYYHSGTYWYGAGTGLRVGPNLGGYWY
jgi:serine protease Do